MFTFRSVLLCVVTLLLSSQSFAQFVARDPKFFRSEPLRVELNAPGNSAAQPTADPTIHSRFQRALDSVYALTSIEGRYGITASIIMPGGDQWKGTAGISQPGVPLSPEHLVEIASNTKTFVTAAILQLEEEGKLVITDPISNYLPEFAFIAPSVTIKQLLEHSSGIYDYLNDDPDGVLLIDAYFNRPSHRWTPTELLESIDAPNFQPGTSYKYSNTGFILLGMVIESVTKHRVADELRARFFEPLGLSMTFAGSDEDILGEFAHQWVPEYDGQAATDLGLIEKTGQLSMAWAAGYIVSTPEDMARWAHALYRGKILSQASMTKMLKMNTWPDGAKYGLGTGQVPYGSKRMYGHGGHLFGFSSMMYTNPRDSVTLVIVSNSEQLPDDITPNDYALALLAEVYRPVSSSVSTAEPLRIYQIEGGRTLKIELPEHAALIGSVQLTDILGRTYSPRTDIIGNGARVELDALPRGVFTYAVRSTSGVHVGKVSHAY
jgi:D-alanyl-D-alanine carboxypeptidase